MRYSANNPGTNPPRGWLLPLLLCALLLCGLNTRAATLTVSSSADSGPGTLRNQIAAAASGDTINFSVTGTIMLTNGVIPIAKNLTIAGPGAGTLAVSGINGTGSVHPAFSIFGITSGGVNLSGLTLCNGNGSILGGSAPVGGAIYITGGSVTVTSNTFINNVVSSGYGGAISVSGGSLAVASSIITNNSAGFGGGIFNNGGTVTIANCTICGNTVISNSVADGIGGGIFNYVGSMTIVNSTISGNRSLSTSTIPDYGGGGINNYFSGTLTVANCTITLNSAETGGGIDEGDSATLNLSNSIVANNTAYGGPLAGPDIEGTVTSGAYNLTGVNPQLGPLANYGGPTPTHILLAGSPAVGAGDPNFNAAGTPYDQRGPGFPRVSSGGLCIGAFQLEPNQSGSNFIVNSLTDHDYGSCGPTNGSLREAIKYSPAGAAITFGVTGAIPLTMGDLVISNNLTITGPASAPGITISGNGASRIFTVIQGPNNISPTVNLSTLTLSGGNGAGSTNTGSGGAIYIATPTSPIFVTITNCTLSGNTSTNGGGAIRGGGTLTLANCTLSGNSATNGGAIFMNLGTLTVTSCTVADNLATSTGGGINHLAGPLSLFNTIVAGNSALTDPDLKGTVNSGDYDLVQNTAGATLSGSHNITGQSALLGPLAYNGGPTQTQALLPGSPAIDAGNTTLTTDQRGVARPQGPAPDIGAFELRSIYPPTISIQAIPISQVQIYWYTVTNAWYQLQYSSSLTTNQWSPLTAWIEGGGQMISTNDPVLVGEPQRFYRVAVTNSP